MERATRIERAFIGWKPIVLPLDDTRISLLSRLEFFNFNLPALAFGDMLTLENMSAAGTVGKFGGGNKRIVPIWVSLQETCRLGEGDCVWAVEVVLLSLPILGLILKRGGFECSAHDYFLMKCSGLMGVSIPVAERPNLRAGATLTDFSSCTAFSGLRRFLSVFFAFSSINAFG